ncbi:uncharacterized protein LOC142322216 isoform X2 [Lycorma delicatula]|uniref:uncharacterized protein LOC142322216 isoform X2 n=1 Tax=Lycorma delicatula TaxID=130591 RepID=UPI003F51157C
MDKMCYISATVFLVLIISSYVLIRNLQSPCKEIHIAGKSLDDFKKVEDNFRILVLNVADAFCHYNFILSSETHLSVENIFLDSFDSCPTEWPHADTCVHSKLSVKFDVRPYQLDYNNLTALWAEIQKNPRFKDLGLKPYATPQSNRILIIVLIVIIAILVILLAGATYILRKKIHNFFRNCCNSDEGKGAPECHEYNRGVSSNEQNCEQQFVPPLFYIDKQNSKTQKVLQPSNSDVYMKEGVQNKGFTRDSSDTSGNTSSTVAVEQVDDFDSDDEININFPSPLTAPPLPPRPVKNELPPGDNKNIHYMVTNITF